MKYNTMTLFKSLTALFVCLVTVSAQDESKVKMKVDLVAWGNEIPNLTLKKPDGEGMSAFSFTYNESINYSGPQILAIYQKPKGSAPQEGEESPDSAPRRRPLPEKKIDLSEAKSPLVAALFARKAEEPELVSLVKLPLNSRHITILLAPASNGVYQPYVIDDDPKKLPVGKLRVHNLSRFPIRIEQLQGPQKCQLKPNESFVFRGNSKNRFTYRLSYQKDNQWTPLPSNQIVLSEDTQSQFIVLKSDNQHFVSSDGTRSGFLQSVVLERVVE